MNELATSVLASLGRTTLLLAGAAVAVYCLLRMARVASPAVHRAAWCLVLVQGWLWFRLPVEVPWHGRVPEAPPLVTGADTPAVASSVPETADPGARALSSPQPLPSRPLTAVASAPLEAGPALPVSVQTPSEVAGTAIPAGMAAAGSAPPASVHTPSEATGPTAWPVVLAAIWLAGMGLLASGWLVCYAAFVWLLPRGLKPKDEWVRQWRELLRSRGIRRAVPVRVTGRIGPGLCLLPRGYRLLIPAALWEQLMPAGRLGILRHELAHLERGDVWKSLVVRLVALPHWFNPLAWWAVRQFDQCAEWACDGEVHGPGRDALPEYAKALLVLGEMPRRQISFHPAASGRGLSQRIRRLLDSHRKEDSLMKKLLVFGAALMLAAVCLIRVDLVAKEPADAKPAVSSAGPAGPADAGTTAGAPGPANSTKRGDAPADKKVELEVLQDQDVLILRGDKRDVKAAQQIILEIEQRRAPNAGVSRGNLRYDGKSFEQWRDEFRLELNPKRRTEALKAFAAFGAHGYGKEAAQTIVEVMRQYPLNPLIQPTLLGEMKQAALDAFNTSRPKDYGTPLDPADAVPVLAKELKEGPRNGRVFAAAALRVVGSAAIETIATLTDVVKKDSDVEVRAEALETLAGLDEKGETTAALVREILRGQDTDLKNRVIGQVLPRVFASSGFPMGGMMGTGMASYGGMSMAGMMSGPMGGTPMGAMRPMAQGGMAMMPSGGAGSMAGTMMPDGAAGLVEAPPIPQKSRLLAKVVLEAIGSDDPATRRAALLGLLQVPVEPKEAVAALAGAFEKSKELLERQDIVNVLLNFGPEAKAALPALEKALGAIKEPNSPEAQFLRWAVDTIKGIQGMGDPFGGSSGMGMGSPMGMGTGSGARSPMGSGRSGPRGGTRGYPGMGSGSGMTPGGYPGGSMTPKK